MKKPNGAPGDPPPETDTNANGGSGVSTDNDTASVDLAASVDLTTTTDNPRSTTTDDPAANVVNGNWSSVDTTSNNANVSNSCCDNSPVRGIMSDHGETLDRSLLSGGDTRAGGSGAGKDSVGELIVSNGMEDIPSENDDDDDGDQSSNGSVSDTKKRKKGVVSVIPSPDQDPLPPSEVDDEKRDSVKLEVSDLKALQNSGNEVLSNVVEGIISTVVCTGEGDDIGDPLGAVLPPGAAALAQTNLETIREGEVLEITEEAPTPGNVSPPATVTPLNKAKFIFDDNISEYDGGGGRRPSDPLLIDGRDMDDPELDEMLDLPAELPPPPDGGWGWMIVFVSFLANMVVDGVAYSFSPFLPVFAEHFDEPQGKVAWVSSLLAGVYLSAGPIVSALSNRYGCRVVCMVGGVVSSLAFLSTIWANSIVYLMITQGIIAGFGFGLIYLPAVVCVGYYFEKKRALATGIAVCGSGVGTMVFPPFAKWLLNEVGWEGTNIIFAGLILNCVCFGALMRPLEVPRMTKRELLVRLGEEERQLMASLAQGMDEVASMAGNRKRSSTSNGDPGVNSHLNLSSRVNSGPLLTPAPTSAVALPTIQEGKANTVNGSGGQDEKDGLVGGAGPKVSIASVGAMPRNCSQPAMDAGGRRYIPMVGSVPNFQRRMSRTELVNQLKVIPATPRASCANLHERRHSGASSGPAYSRQSSAEPGPSGVRQRRVSNERRGMMLRPMSRQDIFYSGSISSLPQYKSQQSMLSYRESTLNLRGTGASLAVLQVIEGPTEALDSGEDTKKDKCACVPDSIRGTLSQMMDFSLLKDPVFLLIGFANVFGMLGFYTPYVYLPNAAIEKGISPESATFLISIIGITNTIGRVLSGVVADMEQVNALYVNNVCVLGSGLCVFFTPYASSYASFVVLAVCFGFFVSGYISLTSIILVELLGLSQLTNAFGLLILFRGTSSMVGPPLSGSIYDATESYDVSFYCAGILLFICAGLYCLVPLAKRHCAAHRKPVHYMTNEEYLDDLNADNKSDDHHEGMEGGGGEGAGITIDIGPKLREDRISLPTIGLQKINEGEAV